MGGLTFLPFVREARKDTPGLAKTDAPAAAAGGGGAAVPKPPAPAPTADIAVSPEVAALAAEIATKGDKIRELKAAKADKETLQPHLDELIALKDRHKELTGVGSSQATEKKPEKDKKKTATAAAAVVEEVKKVPCQPPAVPILAPAYTSPVPAPRSKYVTKYSIDHFLFSSV